MPRKARIVFLALAVVVNSLLLTGCSFIDLVERNDATGKFLGVTFDDENEVEKLKKGESEIEKSFKEQKEIREEREKAKKAKKEKKKEEKGEFIIRWK